MENIIQFGFNLNGLRFKLYLNDADNSIIHKAKSKGSYMIAVHKVTFHRKNT